MLATFLFFGLFPLAVWAARGYAGAVLAFVVGGLRELGEPARKAQIVDLAGDPAQSGRDVGLYYLLRGLTVAPAAVLGGLLWQQRPWLPLAVAGAVGLCGAVFYGLTSFLTGPGASAPRTSSGPRARAGEPRTPPGGP